MRQTRSLKMILIFHSYTNKVGNDAKNCSIFSSHFYFKIASFWRWNTVNCKNCTFVWKDNGQTFFIWALMFFKEINLTQKTFKWLKSELLCKTILVLLGCQCGNFFLLSGQEIAADYENIKLLRSVAIENCGKIGSRFTQVRSNMTMLRHKVETARQLLSSLQVWSVTILRALIPNHAWILAYKWIYTNRKHCFTELLIVFYTNINIMRVLKIKCIWWARTLNKIMKELI